jgi:hypothetical protein
VRGAGLHENQVDPSESHDLRTSLDDVLKKELADGSKRRVFRSRFS